MQIEEQLDPILRKNIKKRKLVAVIPVGSIEQHGPHLPISTDSDIVTEISERVSQKCNYLLLPTISYGISFEHAPFFNLSISGITLQKLLSDICNSLFDNHIKTIFVINGHHGNQKALNQFESKINKNHKGRHKVNVFSYWHFMKKQFDHAGFVETSIMLAISKNVKMSKSQRGLITEGLSKEKIAKLSRLASKSFPKVTKNGIWGDPTNASIKEGKKLLSEITKNLSKKCQTCLTETI